jgi:hypothetical protein
VIVREVLVHLRRRSFPVHVDTLEVLHLEHKDEPHVKDQVDVSNCTACYPQRVRLHQDVSVASACLVVIP